MHELNTLRYWVSTGSGLVFNIYFSFCCMKNSFKTGPNLWRYKKTGKFSQQCSGQQRAAHVQHLDGLETAGKGIYIPAKPVGVDGSRTHWSYWHAKLCSHDLHSSDDGCIFICLTEAYCSGVLGDKYKIIHSNLICDIN